MGFFSLLETVNNIVRKNNFTIQKGEVLCLGSIDGHFFYCPHFLDALALIVFIPQV